MPEPTIEQSPGEPRRGNRWLLAVAVLFAGIAVAVLVAALLSGGSDDHRSEEQRIADLATAEGGEDPFAYTDERSDDFVDRATLGYSHVLYDKSPGGIVASAKRTARWRPLIEKVAAAHGVDPDTMEGMVLLESAGRPDVIAGDDPEVASGLAQIVASTGIDFLDMDIDLPRSKALTRQIAKTEAQTERARKDAQSKKAKVRSKALLKLRELARRQAQLERQRRAVDARFRPADALDGMARYLELAQRRFGAADLATESYHMGIGNLETAIGDYLGTDASGGAVGGLVDESGMSYSKLFFDSSPLVHAKAWDLLSSLGDDSSTYLWRVLAAERIMELYRQDPAELKRLDELQSAKSTQEEVFHPEGETDVFATPDAIRAAMRDGTLEALPHGPDLGYRIDKRMGELAPNLGTGPGTYRALQPAALAALIYMTAKVRAINGDKGRLTVTSTVRDQEYQRQLLDINSEATPNYSLHTTGWSFDIARDYTGDKQAEAFQFVLDRLRALNVIDYAVEPDAIHVTVSDGAQPLLDAVE
jgi:multidrug efflux pump subunit AcrA (membrane-fusion protein)